MKGEERQEIKGKETRGKYERKRKTYINTGFKCEYNQSSDNNALGFCITGSHFIPVQISSFDR